jgi:hypothetical protein
MQTDMQLKRMTYISYLLLLLLLLLLSLQCCTPWPHCNTTTGPIATLLLAPLQHYYPPCGAS